MSEAAEKQRKALGKGLSALLPGRSSGQGQRWRQRPHRPSPSTVAPSKLPIDAIHPNPMQPRVVFQPERLEELAASIRANGIIQPLIVRRHRGAVSTGSRRAPVASRQASRPERGPRGYSRDRGSSAA